MDMQSAISKQHLLQEHALSKAQRQAILTTHANNECVPPDQVELPGHMTHQLRVSAPQFELSFVQLSNTKLLARILVGIRKHTNKKHGWRKTKDQPEF